LRIICIFGCTNVKDDARARSSSSSSADSRIPAIRINILIRRVIRINIAINFLTRRAFPDHNPNFPDESSTYNAKTPADTYQRAKNFLDAILPCAHAKTGSACNFILLVARRIREQRHAALVLANARTQ
jgi:hypothetical protein